MLKKIAAAIATCLALVDAGACQVIHNTSASAVNDAIHKNGGWGFDNYEAICEKLTKANAALLIDGHATVLGNRSVAWASVSLKDKSLMVFTNDFGGSATKTNENASMDVATSMLADAINSAINSMDIDKALQGLDEARKQARAAYSHPSR